MGPVDALCPSCRKPFRWLAGSPMVCSVACRLSLLRPSEPIRPSEPEKAALEVVPPISSDEADRLLLSLLEEVMDDNP